MDIYKDSEAASALLRQRGVQLICYIDNILLIAESKDQARDWAQVMVHLLECLGFIINTQKSVLILDQTIEFLGLTVDSGAMTSSCEDKIDSSRGLKDSEEGRVNLSPNISMSIGEDEFNNVRNYACTSILQTFADGSLQ